MVGIDDSFLSGSRLRLLAEQAVVMKLRKILFLEYYWVVGKDLMAAG